MFYWIYDTNSVYEVPKALLIFAFVISFAILLTFYALRSIGVYKLAKNSGVKYAGLAFVPYFWIYTACRAIGDSSGFFGKSFKRVALILGIVFTACSCLALLYDVLCYYPLVSYAISAGDSARIYYSSTMSEVSGLATYPFDSNFYVEGFVNAYPNWLLSGLRLLTVINMLCSFAIVIIEVSVYFSLFRKFWPAHYLLASLLSIFVGLFPIFVFAIRNNKGVSYADYIREKYAEYYARRYGNAQNGTSGTGTAENKEPFSDYKGNDYTDGGDPFEEFSDDKKDK